MKLGSAFLEPVRDAYNVKDAYGNLLGYVKKQRLKSNFWFEGTDGTRMGEIRSSKKGYEVYDAQNQLRATLIQKQPSPGKRKSFLLGIVLFLVGLPPRKPATRRDKRSRQVFQRIPNPNSRRGHNRPYTQKTWSRCISILLHHRHCTPNRRPQINHKLHRPNGGHGQGDYYIRAPID